MLASASNSLSISLPEGFLPDKKPRKDRQNEQNRQNTVYICHVFGYKRIREVSGFELPFQVAGCWFLVSWRVCKQE
jgi:hypothetical protein